MGSRIQYNLKNQVWLITGSSRGIGRAVAIQAAEAGAVIALHFHRNGPAAQETLGTLSGQRHVSFQADMKNPEALESLVQKMTDQMGRIDVLVNNAGIYGLHDIHALGFTEWKAVWENMLAVNLTGPAHLSFLVAKRMMTQGGGKIINISSRGAYRGEPDAPAYGASKAGLNALTQSLAQALAGDNIFVYGIAPGFVETGMAAGLLKGPEGETIRNQSPLGRAARPEEVAEAVMYLASGNTQYMTGAVLDINGASYLR